MADRKETRAEALRQLSARAEALEARTVQTPQDYGVKAAGYGYRLLGVLLGGLFVGLGFGAAVDALARTAPWGMIVGVLVGFAVSIWMTVRSARRMQAEFERELGPPRDLPPDDEED
ncbi:F0F1 ATP synthase assembly protein I [Phenylobacterium sp.]|uniref:AtpZ/AtpI family protein n=1 Tax=Phenylobacterium sp. TaxID=1871053 RepID=UPI00301DA6EF